jgi:hypothetical protein
MYDPTAAVGREFLRFAAVFEQRGDMPATRTRKPAPRRVAAIAPSTDGRVEDLVRKALTERMTRRLRLNEGDAIPEGIQNVLDAAARDAAKSTVELGVMRDLQEVVYSVARTDAFMTRDELALLKAAEELAVKGKALEAAGFSREEAMQILVAEVSGGSLSWQPAEAFGHRSALP